MDMQITVPLLPTCTSPFQAAMLVLSLLFSTQCLHLPFHRSHFPSLLSCLLLSCAFASTVPASSWDERLQVGFHHCVRVGELLLLPRFVQNFLRDHIPQSKNTDRALVHGASKISVSEPRSHFVCETLLLFVQSFSLHHQITNLSRGSSLTQATFPGFFIIKHPEHLPAVILKGLCMNAIYAKRNFTPND